VPSLSCGRGIKKNENIKLPKEEREEKRES